MKDRRIVTAWDQTAPSENQKERMRSALELRMEGAGEREENRNLDIQRLPVTKKTNPWIPIAAVLALVLAGAAAFSWLRETKMEPVPSMVAPTVETTAPLEDREAAFQPIIRKYIAAITEGWDAVRCQKEDISILTQDAALEDWGYALMDMNDDGQNELLITDGYVIYDMYVLVRGEVHHMFTQSYTETGISLWYLCGKNVMLNIDNTGTEIQYRRMSYMDGKELWAQYIVHSDGTTEGQTPWEPLEGPLSEDMTDYILGKNERIYIRHTPFSGNLVESDKPDDESLLNLYAASIPGALENYSKDQPVTFCFYDYNSDGKRELILGAGKTHYAALSTYESTGEIRISKPVSGMDSDTYFCEDGVLKTVTYGDPITIDFSRKDEGPYFLIFQTLRYDRKTDTWNEYIWGEGERVLTPQDAQKIVDSYPVLNLDWQSIEDFPVKVPALPIDLFQQAFVPVAAGVVDNTWNQLDGLLYTAGVISWGRRGNQVEILNPADKSSSLTAVLTGEEGRERIQQLLFTMTVNEIPRTVSVEFTPEGPQYKAFTSQSGKGVKVESVEELRSFLTRVKRTMDPWILAEEFAYAWFTQDKEAMDRAAKNGAVREFMDGEAMGPETEIEKMVFTFPSGGNYIASADVSIAFNEPGVTDSYTYLDLHMFMDEQGEWFVETMRLGK